MIPDSTVKVNLGAVASLVGSVSLMAKPLSGREITRNMPPCSTSMFVAPSGAVSPRGTGGDTNKTLTSATVAVPLLVPLGTTTLSCHNTHAKEGVLIMVAVMAVPVVIRSSRTRSAFPRAGRPSTSIAVYEVYTAMECRNLNALPSYVSPAMANCEMQDTRPRVEAWGADRNGRDVQ